MLVNVSAIVSFNWYHGRQSVGDGGVGWGRAEGPPCHFFCLKSVPLFLPKKSEKHLVACHFDPFLLSLLLFSVKYVLGSRGWAPDPVGGLTTPPDHQQRPLQWSPHFSIHFLPQIDALDWYLRRFGFRLYNATLELVSHAGDGVACLRSELAITVDWI